jgi:predicted XRE-type DNA-binding protein
MSDDDLELIHGSGNIFRDLGQANPDAAQLKSMLAAAIIAVLDDQAISVRRAHAITGFAAADFSRVRQSRLSLFTIDRLLGMLDKLGREVEFHLDIRPRRPATKTTRKGRQPRSSVRNGEPRAARS